MNLNGVIGDSRKRIEQAAAEMIGPPFDQHPECLLCGRRSEHSHAPDLNYVAVPRD